MKKLLFLAFLVLFLFSNVEALNITVGSCSNFTFFNTTSNTTYEDQICAVFNQTVPVGGCPSALLISGQKIAGKTIKFDIRDVNYNRVKNPATIINMQSTETGTTYSVECPDGSCTWTIPENEKGILMVEVIVPGCSGNVVTSEIELKMAGNLMISVPGTIYYGKDFYIFVYDPTSGPIKYANIQVMGPGGDSFNGKTNENGIVFDESLTKKYGIDIKPSEIGKYKVFASLFGYNSATQEFEITRQKCIYECCVEGEYEAKPCQEGYQCNNNKCVKIEKPKVKIECEPTEPIVSDVLSCKLLDNNNAPVSGNVQASLSLDGKQETVTFVDGYLNYTVANAGKLTLSVSDFGDYSGNSYSVNVKAPEIPAWAGIVVVVVIVIVIVIILLLRRKKRGKGPEITLESSPITVEKVITEK